MKEYYINTYTIDDEWKEANPRKYNSADYLECFVEDIVNMLYKLGYKIEQIIQMSGNCCTIMYSGGN